MISAYRWKVIGGILAGIWSVILIIFSSATHHHTYFQDLIVSLSSYLAIGLLLVILYNYFESQNLKLKESENLYRQLFEQANDAILIVDNEGNIVNCNNVASNLIGYSRNQLLSKNLKEFIIPCPEQINQIENVDPQSCLLYTSHPETGDLFSSEHGPSGEQGWPVSYTHLDVYKRQAITLVILFPEKVALN